MKIAKNNIEDRAYSQGGNDPRLNEADLGIKNDVFSAMKQGEITCLTTKYQQQQWYLVGFNRIQPTKRMMIYDDTLCCWKMTISGWFTY